ncbi:MAG: hypothetical protein R2799_16490 [Crocinitomicaceae bacterium]
MVESETGATYDEDVFAILITNNDLGDIFKNRWQLFTKKIPDVDSLQDKVILASHPSINQSDYKLKNLCIRKFSYKEEKLKVGMFEEVQKILALETTDSSNPSINIYENLNEFKVIGVQL